MKTPRGRHQGFLSPPPAPRPDTAPYTTSYCDLYDLQEQKHLCDCSLLGDLSVP